MLNLQSNIWKLMKCDKNGWSLYCSVPYLFHVLKLRPFENLFFFFLSSSWWQYMAICGNGVGPARQLLLSDADIVVTEEKKALLEERRRQGHKLC